LIMNVQKGPWGSIDLNFVSPIFLYDNQLILLGTVREDTTCPEGGFNCVILCVLSAAPFYPTKINISETITKKSHCPFRKYYTT